MDSIGDRIRDSITNRLADSTGKVQVGFHPGVCTGCPHRGGPPLEPCGLCGCPTIPGAPLDRLGMVPEGCPRIEEHANKG